MKVATRPSPAAVPETLPRYVFLTDIVTPYMAAVQAALAELVDLTVVFCSQTGTRGAAWEFADGLPFRHEVVEGLTIRRRSTDATDYYLSPRIFGALWRRRPEVVVCAGYSVPTLYAAQYCKLTGAGLVIHSDGTSFSERSLNPLQQVARRVLLGLEPACVANSTLSAERFAELGVPPERLFLAPHSTQLRDLWEVAARRRIGDPGELRVLCVGRLIPRKGIAHLIRAVAKAARHEPGITLRLVGTGPEEEALRALAAETVAPVEFGGFVDQPGLPAEYAAADAFAFPTLDDPFGLVLLEAAASGLPLVASPHGGATTDLVVENGNGFVREPTDEDALADVLVRLARDPLLRSRLGKAAHAQTKHRTPERAAQGYVAAGASLAKAGH
jgi:glycosyltransferase involved in cell wall biosynthesis